MTKLSDVGYVTPVGEDIFPTTGPHLDVRVLKDGKYIDPGTIRSLLTRLKVGKDRKPLWQQTGEEWKPGYAITSGYGKRDAPTAGASTFHLGQDYAVPERTPLAWEGAGEFIPGRGYSSIKTADPQGTPYEVRLLHTKGGKGFNLPQQQAQPPIEQQSPQQRAGDTYIVLPGSGKKEKPDDFLNDYVQSLMARSPQIQSGIDPVSMLTAAFNQTPNYLG